MNGNFNDFDPDSLTTILLLNLDDQTNWTDPLNQFKFLINQTNINSPPMLSPPFTDLTESFLFSCMPKVVAKCLDTALNPDLPVVSFLEEVITSISISLTFRNSLQPLPLLNSIFDTAQIFYIHNGRTENLQYSKHLSTLAEHCVVKFIPDILFSCLQRENLTIQDFVEIASILSKLNLFLPSNKLISDSNKASELIYEVLSKFGMEPDDERNIPHRQILAAIPNIISFIHHQNINEILNELMMRFLDVDIAEMKISGIKIAVIMYTNIFTKYLNDNESARNDDEVNIETAQSIIEYVLSQVSNFEGLSLMKPIFITFAEKNSLGNDLIEGLWNIINTMPPTVLSKSIDLYSEICLKARNNELVNKILEIAFNSLNFDLLAKLITGKQFTNEITDRLLELAEGGNESQSSILALDALIKVSHDVDLSMALPKIYSNLSNAKSFKKNIILIDSILTKAPQAFDTHAIFTNLAANISMFSDDELMNIIKACASILEKTHSLLQKNELSQLLNECKSNYTLIIIIKELFPSKAIIVESEASLLLIKIIQEATNNKELFEVITHLHLNANITNQELKKCIEDSLWSLYIKSESEEQRKLFSSILLTLKIDHKLNETIYGYVKKCLDVLLEDENQNAAIFIADCLRYLSKFVSIHSFGFDYHYYTAPEDFMNITYEANQNFETIHVNKYMRIGEFVVLLSDTIKSFPLSLILYQNGKSISYEMYDLIVSDVLDESNVLEIKFKTVFDRIPGIPFDNHPISLLRQRTIEERLLSLLDSRIASEIYDILIQLPTMLIFTIQSSFNYQKPYHLLYDLHYYVNNLHNGKIVNITDLRQSAADILISHYDNILPEARYLLSLLIDPTIVKDNLVNVVLFKLCKDKENLFFDRTSKALWQIVSNYSIDLSVEVLSTFIFNENKDFLNSCLTSQLILKQDFAKVWNSFLQQEDKEKHLNIFTKFEIPEHLYQDVFNTLFPMFGDLNESILIIFAKLCEKWHNFPVDKISDVIIDNYIKCNKNPRSISVFPFKLIQSIMAHNQVTRKDILSILSETIPSTNTYNYSPMGSFKGEICGLSNLGATCYVNSVLQLLFNIEPIRNFIISTNFYNPSMDALRKLFTEMQYSQRKYIDMHSFASSWTGWDGMHIRPRDQQDANEFLMLLFSRLEPYPEVYSLVSGTQEVVFSGDNFNKVKSSSFNTLQLLVMGMNSISDSLKVFSIPEIIENYKVDDNRIINVESYNKIVQLPPYLFIQLKRFDYSIETGTRMKVDQHYEFEDVIDFNDELSNDHSNIETKYQLKGVVIHQGEAEAGHYFSYILKDKKWYSVNDVHIKLVDENRMKLDAYGKPDGTSAYLLLYERLDVISNANSMISIEPDPKLLETIKNDNLHLTIDSIYYTSYFSDFIANLLQSTDDCFNVAIQYYTQTLASSSLVSSFTSFSNTIKELFDKNETIIDEFIEYIQNHIEVVINIMTSNAPKQIKTAFSDVIYYAFLHLPADNILIIVLASQLVDWYPIILNQWRNGFDFFKIFSDYASISKEHIDFIEELGIVPGIISFISESFKPYLINNVNNVSSERFKQQIDLTYIFKLFEITSTDISLILSPNLLEWCVGSRYQTAFIHCISVLCPSSLPQFDKYIDNAKVAPSEYLIAELINFPEFRIPLTWITKYFSEPAEQKHLLRAIFKEFLKNFNVFQMFVFNHADVLSSFLFSQVFEVREETSDFLIKLQDKGPVARLLMPFVSRIVEVSKTLYSNPNYKINYLPLDCFVGLHFLNFLALNASQMGSLAEFVPVFESTLHQLVEMKAQRDEHSIPIAEIGLLMAVDSSITQNVISNQFIADIESVVIKMIPDHKKLDSMIKSLCNALIYQYQKNNIPVDLLMPDNEIKTHIFKLALGKEFHLSNQSAMDLIIACTERYAAATRTIKFLFNELSCKDFFHMPNVYQILCYFHEDVIESNAASILTNQNIVRRLIGEIKELGIGDQQILQKIINFINVLCHVSNNAGLHYIQNAITGDPKCLQGLVQLTRSAIVSKNILLSVVDLLMKLLPCVGEKFESVYGQIIIADNFKAFEIDHYVSFLIITFMMNNKWKTSNPFVQTKIAQEVETLFLKATAITDISKTLTMLSRVPQQHLSSLTNFNEQISKRKSLVHLWSLTPNPTTQYAGVYHITTIIVQSGLANSYLNELLQAAEKNAQSESAHKNLMNMIQSILSK